MISFESFARPAVKTTSHDWVLLIKNTGIRNTCITSPVRSNKLINRNYHHSKRNLVVQRLCIAIKQEKILREFLSDSSRFHEAKRFSDWLLHELYHESVEDTDRNEKKQSLAFLFFSTGAKAQLADSYQICISVSIASIHRRKKFQDVAS